MDIIFHYPPELLALLKDAIPKLCKSKADLLLFFRSAGVSQAILGPHQALLTADKAAFNKYHVTRDLLTALNAQGEVSLGERRAILKRVTEMDDFSGCWESDRAAAQGLVAQIRQLVDVKDSFTRMRLEREEERKKRLAERDAALATAAARDQQIDAVKQRLFSLFAETDPHKRGKALEAALNALFAAYGVAVKEAFTVKSVTGEGVIEQIDGMIELDGILYLVEMKWWSSPIGAADIAPHIVRVFGRGGQARGIFISYSDFSGPAVVTCRDALTGGAVITLVKLQEVVRLLDTRGDLRALLKAKVTAAIADKKPYFEPNL